MFSFPVCTQNGVNDRKCPISFNRKNLTSSIAFVGLSFANAYTHLLNFSLQLSIIRCATLIAWIVFCEHCENILSEKFANTFVFFFFVLCPIATSLHSTTCNYKIPMLTLAYRINLFGKHCFVIRIHIRR